MDIKRLGIAGALAAVLAGAGPTDTAGAAEIRVFGDRYDIRNISRFYDGLEQHNASVIGALTPAALAGVSLLWAVQPADAYGAQELSTMASFLSGGGRIAFMGEHGTYAPAENRRINDAIAALGGTITIENRIVDPNFRSATRLRGQILDHPLTDGVNAYEYAAFAPLLVSGTAEILMRGQDEPDTIMMAYQNIGAGSIFLITDQNVWDGGSTWPRHDNARMFENLIAGETGAPPVTAIPEPATLALFGMGLAGLIVARRRV